MTKPSTTSNALLACLLGITLFLFTACDKAMDEPSATNSTNLDLQFVALTKDLMLQTYNANNLSTPIKSVKVTGLISAETVFGLDFRPATGQLYVLGNTGTLYTVNLTTGVATLVGNGPFTPALSGMITAFDFNPTVDRIRIVTTTGQNLRVNPETGVVQNVDGIINGAAGAQISSAAYTNNLAGATTTVLYDIDVNTKKLYRQDPPNNGTLVEVGNLTIPTSSGESGFDIGPDGTALATVSNGGASSLFQIDLATGAATNLGAFSSAIIGIAIPTNQVAYAVDESNNLMIFNPSQTAIATRAITGLQAGETLYGIDFRPATGQLYALGSTSRLYTVNLSSGAAAQVGSTQLSPMLMGTSFGFDFNPTVDRIRVVSNMGQNLRLDPNTGLVAATDGMLNPGTPSVSAAAYTNNFAGATTTALYDIDFATDSLYLQNPPNNGTLVRVGTLGINVEAGNGFDIGGASGTAYAILTAGGTTRLYMINLTTGAAMMVPTAPGFSTPVRGFALGLGF